MPSASTSCPARVARSRRAEAAALVAEARSDRTRSAARRSVGVFADQDPDEVAAIAGAPGPGRGPAPRRRGADVPRRHPAAGHQGAPPARRDAERRAMRAATRRGRDRARGGVPRAAQPAGDPARHGRPATSRVAPAAGLPSIVAAAVAHAGAGHPRRRPRRRRTSPTRCSTVPAIGVDIAGGVEPPPGAAGRPAKDPVRVALFVKRARAARLDLPGIPFGPQPVDPGLLEPDAPRPLGHRAPVRRPVRARDADGRAARPRGGVRADPARARVLGGAARATGAATSAGRPALPR